jgi:hypothetical protein
MVQLVDGDPAFAEAILDGTRWKTGVMLLPGEALLLGGGDDPPGVDERGRAVMIKGGDPQDAHGSRLLA